MSNNINFDRRAAQIEHKNKLNNLRANQKHEREKTKDYHNSQMREMKHQNKVQLEEARLEHKKAFMEQARRHEKILGDMKNSLEQVKEQTAKEMENTLRNHEEKKTAQNMLFKADYKAKKSKHQMLLEDVDHEANTKLQKMQRQANRDQEELKQTSRQEKKHIRDGHLTHMEMKRAEFLNQKSNADNKFQDSLLQQKIQHTNTLATNERKYTDKMKQDSKLLARKHKVIIDNGKARTQTLQSSFEGKFKNLFNKNEAQLQELAKKKEKIVNDVKSMLKRSVKLSMDKDKDPFYQNTTLEPRVSENPQKDGYTVQIDIPKYDANQVKLSGSGRDLRLSLDRDYTFTKELPDGSTSKVSKTETIVRKMQVGKIINPNSIEREYKDGVLTFKVGLS